MAGRSVAGVAAGLAEHLGLSVTLVRAVLVVLALTGGIGFVLYAALWAVLPLDVDPSDERATALRGSDTTRLLALAAIAVGAALLLTATGLNIFSRFLVPILVAVFGAALIWRQTDDEQRDAWSSAASRAARQTAGATAAAGQWRILFGAGLVVLAIVGLVASHTTPGQAAQGLAIAVLILSGAALVIFPYVYRRMRQESRERRALIRAEERAEIALHVHDSVLQTLTLIQRNAGDQDEVRRLARTEERTLRSWLYAPTGDPERTFAAAVQHVAADVESTYGAAVEVVTVGDADLDAGLAAIVAACREAIVNAAKHGGHSAAVYAEVDPARANVFVRDRGPGFDPSDIPPDRQGVRKSIIERMERNGGTATIRCVAGTGTEVHLQLSRTPEPAQ